MRIGESTIITCRSDPGHRTDRPAEPPVRVAVEHDDVIVRIVGRLDRDATGALVETMDAAVRAGCCVVLELDRATPAGTARPTRLASRPAPGARITASDGAGVLLVPTVSGVWTVDVVGQRLCTHAARDLRFLPTHAWIRIGSLILGAQSVAATYGGDVRDLPASDP